MDRARGFYDEAAETMSAGQRRAFQESFLGPLVEYCYERSSTYRDKLETAGVKPGDVKALEDLPNVPVTRKHETLDMKFEGIMAVPYNEARRIFVSPGPQFYAFGPIPQKLNPLLKVYHAMGFRPGDIVLNTFSYHLTPAGINFDESLGEFGCAVVPAGPGNTELLIDVLQKLPVTAYAGTPSFLKIIAMRARDLGVVPRDAFSLEAALTSAEALPQLLREELEDIYGATVRQLYGSADGLLPCFECWAADGMHVPEMMILEIVDPESGEPKAHGETGAVCASFFNPYRPLLRFLNGDAGVLTDEACRCGRTSLRFRFAGRIDEGVKVRGMFVYPDDIAKAMGDRIWRARVAADADGLDVFNVEVEGDTSLSGVTEALRRAIRVRADVRIIPAGTIGEDHATLKDIR